MNKVAFLGLDNAGKTTLVEKLEHGTDDFVEPTLGVNLQKLYIDHTEINIYDLGGQKSIRQTWATYLGNANLIVFVVDATDYERFSEASSELHKLKEDPLLKDVPVILVANKSDIPSSYSLTDVQQYINMSFQHCISVGLMEHVKELEKLIVDSISATQQPHK